MSRQKHRRLNEPFPADDDYFPGFPADDLNLSEDYAFNEYGFTGDPENPDMLTIMTQRLEAWEACTKYVAVYLSAP